MKGTDDLNNFMTQLAIFIIEASEEFTTFILFQCTSLTSIITSTIIN